LRASLHGSVITQLFQEIAQLVVYADIALQFTLSQ
jgi:hypothetical protein